MAPLLWLVLEHIRLVATGGCLAILRRLSKINELKITGLVHNDIISLEVMVVEPAIVKLPHEFAETTTDEKGLVHNTYSIKVMMTHCVSSSTVTLAASSSPS
jgi:hypothetical protein